MKKGLEWPIGVAVVLVLTVAGNIYVAMRANEDPSVHVEEDYYQKAVRFDADQALKKRSDRLGWHLTVSAARTSASDAAVTAALTDSAGAPVRGAVVRFAVRAIARENDVFKAVGVETNGAYIASLPMARRGLWDVNVEASRGPDRYVTTQRVELPERP